MTEEGVAVDELKRELALLLDADGDDAELFPHLADRRFERCLAGLEPAAGSVHLARTEPPLLLDEQDALGLDDEKPLSHVHDRFAPSRADEPRAEDCLPRDAALAAAPEADGAHFLVPPVVDTRS